MATGATSFDELEATFRRLDPAARRADLWGWLGQGDGDLRRLWSTCPRGDWLAWWMVALRADPRILVGACCECMRMAESVMPACEDAPRRLVAAAALWAEGGPSEPCALLAPEVWSLAGDERLPGAMRAVALGAVWLGRLVLGSPAEEALSPHADEAATQAYLTLWHAAAAISSDVNPDESPGSGWWVRCLEAALGRFAEVIRGCVSLDDLAL